MKIEFSCDDGQIQDLKVAEILEEFGFKGTFYIPNYGGLDKEQIRTLSEKHEIGGHTVHHPQDLKTFDDENLRYEIEWNKQWLEELIGRKITKFCYPRGRYDDRVVEAVKKAGYEYARTTLVLSTDLPEDPFRVKTTIHAYPHRTEYAGKDWVELAKKKFFEAKTYGGYFHLWCHGIELEKMSQFANYKELVQFISKNKKYGK